MGNWLEWLKDEVSEIPGELADAVKKDIQRAAADGWRNIRTATGNAVNQLGAAMTSTAAGAIAPSNRQPVTIPLSSAQLAAVAAVIALLIGYVVYRAVKR